MKEKINQKLAAARAGLLDTLEGLDEAGWSATVYAEGDSWSVADLVGHLADAEWGMTRLVQQIQQGGEGAAPDFDLERWNARAVARAREKSPAGVLAQMAENRANLLALIETLQEEDWPKQGRHGSGHVLSIEQIVRMIAVHEKGHTADIRRALDANQAPS